MHAVKGEMASNWTGNFFHPSPKKMAAAGNIIEQLRFKEACQKISAHFDDILKGEYIRAALHFHTQTSLGTI